MSSAISSALAKLDGSLQTVESQVHCLRAGLEVSDDQLSHSLADARQNAAMVRDLIRAERPDVRWSDRDALELLILELEIAAEERRNQQRRTKLLELANELEAGRVKHRSESRSTALNALRLDAIRELQDEAALAEQKKELPGPDASEWLHWACNLEDEKDASALKNLRRDFGAVEAFAGEMEESYWIPGQRVHEGPTQAVDPAFRGATAPSGHSEPPHGGAQSGAAVQDPHYAEALSPSYERQSSEASSAPETPSTSGVATTGQAAAVVLARDPFDTPAVAAPPARYCDRCGSSYTNVFHVCPVPDSVLSFTSKAMRGTISHESEAVADKANGGKGMGALGEVHLISTLRSGATFSPEPAEHPRFDSSAKPAETKAEESIAIAERDSAGEHLFSAEVGGEPSAAKKWLMSLAAGVAEAARGGKWRVWLATPAVPAVAALLIFAALGTVLWRSHRNHGDKVSATAVETHSPDRNSSSSKDNSYPQSGASNNSATQTSDVKSQDARQPTLQDQSAAAKLASSDSSPKQDVPSDKEILTPPVEIPRNSAAKKEEAPSTEEAAMPGSIPGALPEVTPNGTGSIFKDVQVNVPKLAEQKLRISSGVAQGQLVHEVPPQYPSQARQQRIEGTVVLQALIGKDGRVQKVQVLSGPSMLRKAAVEAVKQWSYRPFALNGEPIEADTQINVKFKLSGE